MVRINENYLKLKAGYLFPEIAKRTAEFRRKNPSADIIRLGIGDVTLPLTPSVLAAFHEGVDELSRAESFQGYGPERGHEFLIRAIIDNDFAARGVSIEPDEVFISDGSKCDCGNIQEIFANDAVVAVQDPVYPVYVDTNVMAGRGGGPLPDGRFEDFVYLPCTSENHFRPALPRRRPDLIYLCSPNNPTGAVLTRDDLARWIEYAAANDAIILFDAAYESYISDPAIPHSIFEIDGGKEHALEFRSFSKSAGFTGVRCAFTVVPKALKGRSASGDLVSINQLWNRRHSTKFNGASYPVQKAAAAAYSDEGRKEVRGMVSYYMENARMIRDGLTAAGIEVHGGVNAPYIWLKVPGGRSSWDFFDQLLEKANVVGTPGSGFGPSGEGYFRLSAFGNAARVREALERIKKAGL